MKKKDFRTALAKELPNVLNAVFEQGKAAQRMEDAKSDFEFESEHARKHIDQYLEILNVPEKSEMN